MTEAWPERTLGQTAHFRNGYPFKPSELTGRGLPVVRIKQLLDPLANLDRSDADVGAQHRIADGDLIFSWSGTLASRIWDRGPALLNQHLFRVMERPGVERRWLHLALEHAVDDLMAKTHGTTMKHVTKKALESHSVRLPPSTVQRRIVDLVGALDSQIAAMDSERSAAERQLIAACRTLTAAARYEKVLPLHDVADVLDRLRQPINESERRLRVGAVPYFGANGQVGWIDRELFDEPLVLLAEDGGPVSDWETKPQAYAVEGPAWVNNHAHVLRARQVPRDWLYYSLRHYDLTGIATHGTRTKLTQANMSQINIGLPDNAETLTAALRAMERLLTGVAEERRALLSVRQILLNGLLKGDLSIPESFDSLLTETR